MEILKYEGDNKYLLELAIEPATKKQIQNIISFLGK